MEVSFELEDDVFFADINKQISLLIMDDEEEPLSAGSSSLSLQSFSRGIYQEMQYPILSHEQSGRRRESKGTGVFIPRSSYPRRQNRRQRRTTATVASSNTKYQRPPSDYSTRLPPIAYNSVNHKRS